MARGQRTEIRAEQIIEIADDAERDYTTDKHGNRVFNHESVRRARLDPRLWGERQQVDLQSVAKAF